MPMVEEFKEYLCGKKDIGEGSVAVGGKWNLEVFTECVEIVTGGRWEETLTEEHRAEAFGEFDISPATLLLDVEKAHVECSIVRDEGRIMRKGKEFGENGHDAWSIAQRVVGDVVDPLGIWGYGAFRVH